MDDESRHDEVPWLVTVEVIVRAHKDDPDGACVEAVKRALNSQRWRIKRCDKDGLSPTYRKPDLSKVIEVGAALTVRR